MYHISFLCINISRLGEKGVFYSYKKISILHFRNWKKNVLWNRIFVLRKNCPFMTNNKNMGKRVKKQIFWYKLSSFPSLKNTDLGYQMSIFFLKKKPLISSLLLNWHISLRSKVIHINILKIPVLVFHHWKILSCHDLGYQMSIYFKKLYISN